MSHRPLRRLDRPYGTSGSPLWSRAQRRCCPHSVNGYIPASNAVVSNGVYSLLHDVQGHPKPGVQQW